MVNLFDRVRYPSRPFTQTHPIATGVFAALFGQRFAAFAASRVLEIGCGEGVNLVNMALGAPQAEFVGVDLAERPIALARAAARGCGCANVGFHALDLVDIGPSLGRFDYIIAHGVYAWVPARVREALMRVVGERLSADGLALISYNTLPGSRLREAVRDMLLWVTKGVEDPNARMKLARSFLGEHIEAWSETEADEFAMKCEARRILKSAPEVLFHDELAEDYAPQLLSDAVADAAQFGLRYLSDARPNLSKEAFFPSDGFAAMRWQAGGDWARLEQLADFKSMLRFRYSIFCRGDPDRRWEATRLRGLWACSDLTVIEANAEAPDGAAFEGGLGAEVKTRDPKMAKFLAALAAAFPLAIPLETASESPLLSEKILQLFVSEVIQLTTAQLPIVAVPGERPQVSPLSSLQAANGETALATLRHAMVQIDDASVRALVPLIDGTRRREELALDIAQRDDISAAEAVRRLDEILAKFARAGLLAG